MKITRGFAILASIAALGACTNFHDFDEIKALNEVQAVGSPFTQRLTAEYRLFVNNEVDPMHDHADALHFARKGLATAHGDFVMPEPVTDWNLLPPHVAELGAARARLIGTFDLGARELLPDIAAVAQARFDCWIEQQEENWQPNDIATCKNQFMDALAHLEAAIPVQAPPPAPEPVAAPAPEPFDVDPAQPMEAENAMYLVFFDFDKSDLGPGAQSVLDAVAQEVSGRSINVLNIVGHADTSGPKAYNRQLAMRRANTVRDSLIQRGIDASMIRVDSRGEEELLVQTADDTREPANRRAQISFE